jgi:hypothetical protein
MKQDLFKLVSREMLEREGSCFFFVCFFLWLIYLFIYWLGGWLAGRLVSRSVVRWSFARPSVR